MEIKLKGRELPRTASGDVCFRRLHWEDGEPPDSPAAVCNVFSHAEVVELVNRAIYHIEYQYASHLKRSQRNRDAHKRLVEEMKAKGQKPLKGE